MFEYYRWSRRLTVQGSCADGASKLHESRWRLGSRHVRPLARWVIPQVSSSAVVLVSLLCVCGLVESPCGWAAGVPSVKVIMSPVCRTPLGRDSPRTMYGQQCGGAGSDRAGKSSTTHQGVQAEVNGQPNKRGCQQRLSLH
jgi:hypothetical protein